MKQYLKGLFSFLLPAILMLSACSKDFTEKTPKDSLPIEEALSSETNLQAALNGLYAMLRSVSLYGNPLPVLGDLLADNTFVETNNSGRYIPAYQYTFVYDDPELAQIWINAYTGIMRANLILSSALSSTKVSEIKSQAMAVRALLYFKLVTFYARPYTDNSDAPGVPLVLTYDAYRLPARNKVSEVYAQIVNDLNNAIAGAPTYSSSITLSRFSMEAILARVYLYMGNNSAAKTAAIDVINNSGFTLVQPALYKAYWSDAGVKTTKVETLFEVDADIVNNNYFDDFAGLYYNGYNDIYASAQLYNLYSSTDVRKSVLVPGSTKSGASGVIVTKFPNAANGDRDNIKVIRLSEVYLIAAETSLPRNEADARNYLNAIARLRDSSFAGHGVAATGQALLDAIVLERRKELAFEGDRLFDLNRLKLAVNRIPNAGAIPAGPANANLVIPYTNTRRIAPIPQTEIQANRNIAGQQNPGY